MGFLAAAAEGGPAFAAQGGPRHGSVTRVRRQRRCGTGLRTECHDWHDVNAWTAGLRATSLLRDPWFRVREAPGWRLVRVLSCPNGVSPGLHRRRGDPASQSDAPRDVLICRESWSSGVVADARGKISPTPSSAERHRPDAEPIPCWLTLCALIADVGGPASALLVTWAACGSSLEHQSLAAARANRWNTVLNALRRMGAQVALLQEALRRRLTDASPFRASTPTVHASAGGTAIVAVDDAVTLQPWSLVHWAGSRSPCLGVTPRDDGVADALVDGASVCTVVSLYGEQVRAGNGRTYASTVVHRQISDLVPLLDDSRNKRARVLVAGDLNVPTQWATCGTERWTAQSSRAWRPTASAS
jgi:hypothetical protein